MNNPELSYMLISAMLLVGLLPMLLEMRRGSFDFFNLKNSFILYYLLQLAASGFLTITYGVTSQIGLDPNVHQAAYEQALFLSLAGLIAFQIGYYSRSRRPLPLPSVLACSWKPGRASWLATAYIVIGLLAFVVLVNSNGGLAAFLADRETFRAGGLVGFGILLFPATAVMAIAVMILFLDKARAGLNWRGMLQMAAICAIALTPAFFLGFRSAFALPLLQFMVVWHYGYQRISALRLIVTSLALVVAFTLYGLSRELPAGLNVSAESLVDVARENPELIYAVVSRSKGTEVVASVVEKLGRTGEYELGWAGVVETFTIIIPKLIWDGKPSAISQRFADYFFGDDLRFARGYEADAWSGISPTVVGEWYWHFGWAGVLVGLFALGWVAKGVYSTMLRNRHRPNCLITYAILFTSFTMFAESQQNYANGLVLYAASLLASFWFLNRHRRKRGPAAHGGTGIAENAAR